MVYTVVGGIEEMVGTVGTGDTVETVEGGTVVVDTVVDTVVGTVVKKVMRGMVVGGMVVGMTTGTGEIGVVMVTPSFGCGDILVFIPLSPLSP